jgi:hypothetical protein
MSDCCSRRSPSCWPKGQPPNGVPLHVAAEASPTVSWGVPRVLLRPHEAVLSSCGQTTATVEENAPHVIGAAHPNTFPTPQVRYRISRPGLRSAAGRPALRSGTPALHFGTPWPRCGPAVEKRSGFARAHPERRDTSLLLSPCALTVHTTHQLTPALVQPAGGRASPGPSRIIIPRPTRHSPGTGLHRVGLRPHVSGSSASSSFFSPLTVGSEEGLKEKTLFFKRKSYQERTTPCRRRDHPLSGSHSPPV